MQDSAARTGVTPETHEKFKENLKNSNPAVVFIAKWFKTLGYSVEVKEMTVAETPEERLSCRDHGDLYVTKNNITQRIEVKQRSINFTNSKDWKYGNEFIVCEKESYDRAYPKPFAYIVLSKDYKAAGIVLTTTESKWTTKLIQDKRYGNYFQTFYMINTKEVIWHKFLPPAERININAKI